MNVGSLMLKYGGGGHKRVGTCQFSNESMDTELPKMLKELTELSKQYLLLNENIFKKLALSLDEC